MIILDTNVVSELMEVIPDVRVVSWLGRQATDEVFVTAITVAELFIGVHVLPARRRKDTYETRVRRILELLGPPFIPFGDVAAEQYGRLSVRRGDIGAFDVQIAAIALAHGAIVATRNIKHFDGLGIDVVDPSTA